MNVYSVSTIRKVYTRCTPSSLAYTEFDTCFNFLAQECTYISLSDIGRRKKSGPLPQLHERKIYVGAVELAGHR
jgi:hypothetical protein